MSRYDDYDYGFPEYITVAERKASAMRKLKKLKKKNSNINPIVIEGRNIANTWWGKAWNQNLIKYADYSNRIGRGRSYVRHGAILDLQIEPGKVTSLVAGSGIKPYSITIDIKPIRKKRWEEIKKECEGNLESLQELLDGKFPKALQELFISKGTGLFPTSREINFNCSCPDWAYMCKHVAATLFGIGARLDKDPKLFFILRKVEMNDLIREAIQEKSKQMLRKSRKKTSRVIDDSDVADIFGINMNDEIEAKKQKVIKKKAGKKWLK